MRDNYSKRVSIISVVNTPLGFFVLALLIVEAFLGTVLIWAELDSGQKTTGMWLGVGLFCLVTLAVFALVWQKPQNLTFDKEAHLEKDRGVVYGTESFILPDAGSLPSDRATPPEAQKHTEGETS